MRPTEVDVKHPSEKIVKQQYQKPMLKVLGGLTDVTQAVGGDPGDNGEVNGSVL